MKRAAARALLLLALAGLSLSSFLTYVHYRLHRDPQWQSVCNLSESVNCDAVLLNPLATLGGLPLSVLGGFLYLAILAAVVVELVGNRGQFPRSPAVLVLVLACVGAAASLVLAVLSASVIGAVCLLCTALHLVNLALLAVAWFGVRSTGEPIRFACRAELTHWRRRSSLSAVAMAVGVLSLVVTRHVYATGTVAGSEVCGAVAAVLHRQGGDQGMTLSVFSDFQCRHCRALDQSLQSFAHARHIHVLQEHFPLESACNSSVETTVHAGACLQARAVLCAHSLGDGAKFGARLFDNGATQHAGLIELAAANGFVPAEFEKCLMADDTEAQLRASVARGIAAGVRGTPTTLINGTKYVGRFGAADLSCLLKAEAAL
ncbi:MAG TPA: vitamin K epoxide reductase family protein [Polyangiaceae bacterium]|nr:vitamin K epoxide reductase family protein [Polyangiaceae bacterium]